VIPERTIVVRVARRPVGDDSAVFDLEGRRVTDFPAGEVLAVEKARPARFGGWLHQDGNPQHT
jgi:hypothetical protein